jgi:hypothetical protein
VETGSKRHPIGGNREAIWPFISGNWKAKCLSSNWNWELNGPLFVETEKTNYPSWRELRNKMSPYCRNLRHQNHLLLVETGKLNDPLSARIGKLNNPLLAETEKLSVPLLVETVLIENACPSVQKITAVPPGV